MTQATNQGKNGSPDQAAAFKLRTRAVRKTYGPVVALAGADIDLVEGEFLTLLGPSGSGKTTLLMAIAGLNDPDSGEIWIDGRLATYLPPFKRDLGMVFQNYALFPHMTVYENIAFPLRMRRLPDATIRESVQRVLDTVQLPDVGTRLPRELSGGQQQRIALARCFVYEPSIILMDEPLGALDKKLRDALQREVKHLHQNLGMTVLYVTHDQEEAMVMSDRICLMNDGEIEQIGTPEDLYFRPASVFAADFLGESNLLPATVSAADAREIVLETAGGAVVRALPNANVGKGDRVRFMVRPESVTPVDGAAAENHIEGVLKEIIMSGHITKLFVELADGTEMVSTRLTGQDTKPARVGDRLKIGWPAARTVVLGDGTG
ncbi:MAG: ABC transporter ATP-binding protein [Gammaproteobacteria bacterium]|nr:ABC transporter ATP-binding protein [Gammaproteobacteria bacterium]